MHTMIFFPLDKSKPWLSMFYPFWEKLGGSLLTEMSCWSLHWVGLVELHNKKERSNRHKMYGEE